MQILNVALLHEYSLPGLCELCGKKCRQRAAHHHIRRGQVRLDIPINLVSLGVWPACKCHEELHGFGEVRRMRREQVLNAIAERELVNRETLLEALEFFVKLVGRPPNLNWNRALPS